MVLYSFGSAASPTFGSIAQNVTDAPTFGGMGQNVTDAPTFGGMGQNVANAPTFGGMGQQQPPAFGDASASGGFGARKLFCLEFIVYGHKCLFKSFVCT